MRAGCASPNTPGQGAIANAAFVKRHYNAKPTNGVSVHACTSLLPRRTRVVGTRVAVLLGVCLQRGHCLGYLALGALAAHHLEECLAGRVNVASTGAEGVAYGGVAVDTGHGFSTRVIPQQAPVTQRLAREASHCLKLWRVSVVPPVQGVGNTWFLVLELACRGAA